METVCPRNADNSSSVNASTSRPMTLSAAAICRSRFFGKQPHQRTQGDALAGTGLAEKAEHLAFAERKRRSFTAWTVRSPRESDVEAVDLDEGPSCGGRHLFMEVGRALEGRADGEQGRFVEGATDELHADRKAACELKPEGIESDGRPR